MLTHSNERVLRHSVICGYVNVSVYTDSLFLKKLHSLCFLCLFIKINCMKTEGTFCVDLYTYSFDIGATFYN